jgi:ATP-binding protein involved in chromosome partitioning
LLGRVPLVTELREGGDSGRPIVLTQPDGEAAQAFGRIAETVEVDLAPTRRYNKALKLL